MIIKRFLLWSRTAPPAQRAAAIGALCRAYVDGELELDDRFEAETAMTAMLDDASPLVRRAVAEALADAAEAPWRAGGTSRPRSRARSPRSAAPRRSRRSSTTAAP